MKCPIILQIWDKSILTTNQLINQSTNQRYLDQSSFVIPRSFIRGLAMNPNHSEPLLKSQREPLLQIADLTVDFDTSTGWVRCLYGVDMEVYPGEILGLVGESGSGKSVTCMAVMQLLGPRALVRGNIRYRK
jgi:ABC-type multidrug transport system fused ATPase/permease subunit